ncbi:MAG: DinB family protein [Planctomycetota bacterium]|nr:DinB family protein [Planctomycetota bacterium]
MSEIDAPTLFLRETVIRFRQEYLPRLDAALEGLSHDDIWWRPHDDITSIGALLRHLEGNVRQWILSGLGGDVDTRERRSEFADEARPAGDALLQALKETVQAACRYLDDLDPARLVDPVRIQGIRTTVLGAAYHVLEHFGWHTGQITWIAKLRRGEAHGIAFYDDDALDAARNEG